MYLVRALPVFLTLCAFISAGTALASPADDARQALGRGIDEVSAVLRDRPAEDDLVALLDTLAQKHFAFTTTTRLAVGPAWREFSPAERVKTTELFSRLVVRTYSNRIRGEKAPDITYGIPLELRAGRVEVPTTVRVNGSTYAILYRLELANDEAAAKGWRVYDVVAEGVSLIANYRSQFDPIVRSSGAAGIIKTLEAKLAEPLLATTQP